MAEDRSILDLLTADGFALSEPPPCVEPLMGAGRVMVGFGILGVVRPVIDRGGRRPRLGSPPAAGS